MNRLIFQALGVLIAGVVAASSAAAKERIAYAYLLDPALEGALYGITSGKVTSNSIEIDATALSIPALIEATTTKQYDVIMDAVMAIPRAASKGLRLEVLSTALRAVPNGDDGGVWVKKNGPYKTLADLKGKTIGVTALESTGTTWQRIDLWKKYHFNVSYNNGDFNWVQMPGAALPGALESGRIDAADLIHLQAFDALKSGTYVPLTPTAKDLYGLFGVQYVAAVNVSYPDKLQAHPAAFKEFDRMLKASVDYANAHTAEVGKAIAKKFHISPDFFGWWLKKYSIFPAVVGKQDLKAMEVVWKNAHELHLIGKYPKARSVIWKYAIRQ